MVVYVFNNIPQLPYRAYSSVGDITVFDTGIMGSIPDEKHALLVRMMQKVLLLGTGLDPMYLFVVHAPYSPTSIFYALP